MMFLISGVLVAAYAAVQMAVRGLLPYWASPICDYGSIFCRNPNWLLYAAGACLVWALFLKVDRI